MRLTGKGAQTPQDDHRNDGVLIWLNGRLVPRAQATVSIFDAGFGLGDGVWEGIRYVDGRFVFLDDHLGRLEAGAKAIALDIGLSRDGVREALQQTIDANGMTDGVHIRLMVTRGEKTTIHQDPRNALGRPTIAIVAEHKLPDPQVKRDGLALATTPVRCSPPDMFDMRLNSHSRLNLIQALLPAIAAGAQEALMLDPHGFVSSCNSTNLFFVSGGTVLTSTGRYCFNGITRQKVLDLCAAHGIPLRQADFTLAEAYASEEAFVTGTFGGITPVSRLDGRPFGGAGRPVTERLCTLYEALTRSS
ncbi:branched-chain amino acid aminotransferase (plasmid) [Azospirillum sp. B510]|uniref:aminotransferase class IV n=1 Tax=Azospirillum sp. (strain B510) TaxID=137722 RepID=UPI0001C4BC5D|nr:aminotransferase class IV [Azospirillum sp. B510]BAI74019.1 branched-chain amino acid aminotransferase [Azospirillum sp. B510]